jgi:hypothetical protein
VSWRKRFHERIGHKEAAAQVALDKTNAEYEELMLLLPEVERTVRAHRRIQHENHFQSRVERALGA